MFKQALAVLLVFSWLILSGLDLLEDLKGESEYSAYGQTSKSLSPKSSQHPSLANNIVESALDAYSFYTPLVGLNLSPSARLHVSSSHRAIDLHTLHRVFLI